MNLIQELARVKSIMGINEQSTPKTFWTVSKQVVQRAYNQTYEYECSPLFCTVSLKQPYPKPENSDDDYLDDFHAHLSSYKYKANTRDSEKLRDGDIRYPDLAELVAHKLKQDTILSVDDVKVDFDYLPPAQENETGYAQVTCKVTFVENPKNPDVDFATRGSIGNASGPKDVNFYANRHDVQLEPTQKDSRDIYGRLKDLSPNKSGGVRLVATIHQTLKKNGEKLTLKQSFFAVSTYPNTSQTPVPQSKGEEVDPFNKDKIRKLWMQQFQSKETEFKNIKKTADGIYQIYPIGGSDRNVMEIEFQPEKFWVDLSGDELRFGDEFEKFVKQDNTTEKDNFIYSDRKTMKLLYEGTVDFIDVIQELLNMISEADSQVETPEKNGAEIQNKNVLPNQSDTTQKSATITGKPTPYVPNQNVGAPPANSTVTPVNSPEKNRIKVSGKPIPYVPNQNVGSPPANSTETPVKSPENNRIKVSGKPIPYVPNQNVGSPPANSTETPVKSPENNRIKVSGKPTPL